MPDPAGASTFSPMTEFSGFLGARKTITAFFALVAASTVLVPLWPAWATDYPVKIENCGHELTLDKAPESSVTVGQSATEMLYALGLAETVKGTSVWFNDISGEYAEIDAAIPRIADNEPSFESVVSKKPELVVAQYASQVGEQGGVATREQFHELGVETYVMPDDCVAKDNSVGDGVRSEDFTVDSVYRAIEELAKIFDVEDRGKELINELRERQEEAVARAEALNFGEVSGVFWFSSVEAASDPFVAGQRGIPAYMMEILGITNVVDSDEEWPTVGWETIARADPDVIMIARMDRRRYAADDHEKKLEFLKSDPVTSQMTAVKEDRIIIVDAHAVHASARMFDGLETMADGLEKAGLTQ